MPGTQKAIAILGLFAAAFSPTTFGGSVVDSAEAGTFQLRSGKVGSAKSAGGDSFANRSSRGDRERYKPRYYYYRPGRFVLHRFPGSKAPCPNPLNHAPGC